MYPLHWLLEAAMPRLTEAEERFRATEDADGVRRIAAETRHTLRQSAMSLSGPPPDLPAGFGSPRSLAGLAGKLNSTGSHEAFSRFYYKVARDLAAYGAPPKPKDDPPMPQHLRLPACARNEPHSLIAWTAMMSDLLYPGVPLLLFRPTGESWVDIVVGEPRTPQLFCLLAGLEALPAATDVPYNLDPSVMEIAGRKLSEWSQGEGTLDPSYLRCDEAPAANAAGFKQILGGVKSLFGR